MRNRKDMQRAKSVNRNRIAAEMTTSPPCFPFRAIAPLLGCLLFGAANGFVLPKPSSIKPRQPFDTFGTPKISTAPHRTIAHTSKSTRLAARGAAPAAKKVQAALQSNNALRGKLMLVLSKILVPPAVYGAICKRLLANTYWPEVALIGLMASAAPLMEGYYVRKSRRANRLKRRADGGDYDEHRRSEEEREEETQDILQSYQSTRVRKVARVIQQFGLLQAALYLSDVTLVFLKQLDFKFVVKYSAQQVAGSIITSAWLARNLSRLKFYYLKNGIPSWSISNIKKRQVQQQQQAEASSNSMNVYNRFANRILDVLIYMCATLFAIDLLGIEVGFAFKSIFGLGSFGTLVLSLASKDVAAEFVGGLMIQSSSFFNEGETVILQDGTRGVVLIVGWLHTYIHQDDNYVVRVPNSQIAHQRIAREKRAGRRHRGYL